MAFRSVVQYVYRTTVVASYTENNPTMILVLGLGLYLFACLLYAFQYLYSVGYQYGWQDAIIMEYEREFE